MYHNGDGAQAPGLEAWLGRDVAFLDLCVGDTPHACGLGADGVITCWGGDYYGALQVPDGTHVQLDCGPAHVCALGTDGEIACWGQCWHGACDVPL